VLIKNTLSTVRPTKTLLVNSADYVEAQLLRHAQQVMLEACLQATSARVLEEDHPALHARRREAEPAGPGVNFSLETLDAAVSESLDTHIRRMSEIDTNKANTTSWMIQSHAQPPTEVSNHVSDGRNVHAFSRVLHSLTIEEIREALQAVDAPSSEAMRAILLHVHDENMTNAVFIVDGVCNDASLRLHYAQLRLHIYRQSMVQAGCAEIDVGLDRKRRKNDKVMKNSSR
jgi:hypothetical protein